MFFADAAERKVIRRNPTAGWNAERHLPAIEDKQRGWRERAGFSIDQVVSLTTDPRIPEDRRALYALRFLGGPRPGEASNARWRNLDKSRQPLWRLTLEAAFNSPMRREKSTKTGATLHIPIHPVLQRMLEEWWDEGWARYMGRAPQPDDLIFPRDDGKQPLVSGTYKQFKQDLETLGLATQRQYESRSTFRNLALSAGAAEFHVNLITHPKPKRASDYYTRLEMQWPGMCEAVVAIDASAWDGRTTAPPRWSGKRDLNPRPSPWQGDALPLSYSRKDLAKVELYRSASGECQEARTARRTVTSPVCAPPARAARSATPAPDGCGTRRG